MVGTKMQQKGFLCVLFPEKKSMEMTDTKIFNIFQETCSSRWMCNGAVTNNMTQVVGDVLAIDKSME